LKMGFLWRDLHLNKVLLHICDFLIIYFFVVFKKIPLVLDFFLLVFCVWVLEHIGFDVWVGSFCDAYFEKEVSFQLNFVWSIFFKKIQEWGAWEAFFFSFFFLVWIDETSLQKWRHI
jgi:hypothetical protein